MGRRHRSAALGGTSFCEVLGVDARPTQQEAQQLDELNKQHHQKAYCNLCCPLVPDKEDESAGSQTISARAVMESHLNIDRFSGPDVLVVPRSGLGQMKALVQISFADLPISFTDFRSVECQSDSINQALPAP